MTKDRDEAQARNERIDLVARVTRMLRDPEATKRLRRQVQAAAAEMAKEQGDQQ